MPVLVSAADSLTRRLPKVLSPKAHAAGDYLMAGLFFAAAGLFWRQNRRAALGALFCGGAKLAVSALTDYDDDRSNLVNLPLHGKLDIGVAAMSAAMPELMSFSKSRARKFFIAQAIGMTALANVTSFAPATPTLADRLRARRRA